MEKRGVGSLGNLTDLELFGRDLIFEGFVEPTKEMCFLARFYSFKEMEGILNFAFEYSCLEAEYRYIEKRGEEFTRLNIHNRNHFLEKFANKVRLLNGRAEEIEYAIKIDRSKIKRVIAEKYAHDRKVFSGDFE